jgi:hypothetical protein
MECASSFAYIKKRPVQAQIGSIDSEVHVRQPEAPEVDTNVVEVKFSTLVDDVLTTSSQLLMCSECRAVLNSQSKVTVEAGQVIWACEFCSVTNAFEPEAQLPTADVMTYVIDGSFVPTADLTRQRSIVFCIDISGSMDNSTSVPQGVTLLGREMFSVTYLDCVKAAILTQVQRIQEEEPNSRIGLIFFESKLHIYGDCSSPKKTLSGRINYEDCLSAAKEVGPIMFNKPASVSAHFIQTEVAKVHTIGGTALGPGLLISVGVAIQGGPGSSVIICTDGQANEGLGSVRNLEEAQAFYESVGNLATDHGVNVSVISITGADCRLETLSIVTDITNGVLTKVDPLKLNEDFAEAMSERVLATNVVATVNLHKALKFRNLPASQELLRGGSRLVKQIGNATQFSSFTFEYSAKSQEELDEDLDSFTELPMQAVIEYTIGSARCARVITKVLKTTQDIQQAEAETKFEVLARNMQYQSAALAEQGHLESAVSNTHAWQEVLGRNARSEHAQAQLGTMMGEMEDFNHHLRAQMITEQRAGLQLDSAQDMRHQRAAYYGDATMAKISKMKRKR